MYPVYFVFNLFYLLFGVLPSHHGIHVPETINCIGQLKKNADISRIHSLSTGALSLAIDRLLWVYLTGTDGGFRSRGRDPLRPSGHLHLGYRAMTLNLSSGDLDVE